VIKEALNAFTSLPSFLKSQAEVGTLEVGVSSPTKPVQVSQRNGIDQP
jgi:hypothetical protein